MTRSDESRSSDVWEDLIVAMLSVGGYPLEKVLGIRAALECAGLLDRRNLAAWDEGRVTRELNSAGYSRGMLTGMYAERLVAVIRSLATEQLRESEAILGSDEPERIAKLLLPQHGIGTKVVDNYFSLRHRRRGDTSDPERS